MASDSPPPLHVLERILDVAKRLERWKYHNSDYTEVTNRLEAELLNRAKVKRAPLYTSDEIERLPRIPGFLITGKMLRDYVGYQISVTFYDSTMTPRFRRGVLTDTFPVRLRIETLSGRSWYIQYSRILRIELFQG
ncbi:MAG: hypothetical protein M1431_03975 [Candidatus Thermoplasmatota archaeon]|nr:hypothetical protein [Candidatus Thermoplasmatota archaeon]